MASYGRCYGILIINYYAKYLAAFKYYQQTLLFLRPETLEGEKLDVYCLGKMLKYFTGADVTSYKVKIIGVSFYSICFILA